ncbi:hypothetical protein MMC15_002996 [Xylographa vitiligo]|nr:hypothetical protein [Xylographa vitiligo]
MTAVCYYRTIRFVTSRLAPLLGIRPRFPSASQRTRAQAMPSPPASHAAPPTTTVATADPTTSTQRTAEARAAFLASLQSVGSQGDAELQARAQDIHTSAAALARQDADVAKQTDGLAQQTAQYQQMADESRGKLKEIGDVQNWAEMIERDLLVLEETMRIVDEDAAQGAGGSGKVKGRRRWF